MLSWRSIFSNSSLLALTVTLLGGPATAQDAAKPNQPSRPPAAAKSQPTVQIEPDEKALQAAQRIADPNQRAAALIDLVGKYPEYPYIRNVVFFLFRSPAKTRAELQQDSPADPVATSALVDKFVKATATAPAYARAEFYYGISKYLAGKNVLLPRTVELAQAAVPLLNEADYVANERRKHERTVRYHMQRSPQEKTDPFSEEEARAHFRAFESAVYANLGQALLKTGTLEDAQRAFQKSYAIEPVAEAALGLADIAERRGDTAAALNAMMDGALTGKLSAKDIERLDQMWARQHDGKSDGLKAELDARFRKRFTTPIQPVPYQPATNRSHRVVLAEFVTGAGCEPCTAVDLAFDAALKRYSRSELALVAYHMHAPTSDPLSNTSAEERWKYYDAQGAPTVYLDGVKLATGEGMKTEARRVFENLTTAIERRLNEPEQAHLALEAHLEKGMVKVSTGVSDVRDSGHLLRLEMVLLEDQVSYSGENGLRFHAMVARDIAHPAGFTIAFAGSQLEYRFDLEQISAGNLRYYDWYINDLYKRTQIRASFREKRQQLDDSKLSVVAFLQDETTKQILQSAYVKVPSDHEPSTPAE